MFGIGGWKQVGATFDMKRQAAIREQLEQAGIRLNIETVSALSWDGSCDGAISAFDVSCNPDSLYKCFVTGSSGNFMHYSNTSVDTWLRGARYEEDTDRQTALYQKFEAAYVKYGIQIPIVYPKRYYVISSQIRGFDTNLILCENSGGLLYNIENWSIGMKDMQETS